MAKKLRTAVVGVGYLGNFHAQKYKNISEVELVAVCDFNLTQAQKIGQDLKVSHETDPQKLIGKVDAVTIAASTQSHFELAELFLKNGVHVLVEKPITATIDQAEKIISLAKKNQLKLSVGHIERFNPSIVELSKKMEKPLSFELVRQGPYKARGADVSVLHDLMIHDLDLVHWLSQSEIAEISLASGAKLVSPTLDSAQVALKMKNGTCAFISVSRVASSPVRSLKVLESHQILFANTASLELQKTVPSANKGEPPTIQAWTVEKKDALQLETQAFVDSIIKDQTPVVTGEDGLKALIAVEKIIRSIEN